MLRSRVISNRKWLHVISSPCPRVKVNHQCFSTHTNFPNKVGLYSPVYEKESCGVGFIANLNKKQEHQVVSRALGILRNLEHRGGAGCDENCGDGAGNLIV